MKPDQRRVERIMFATLVVNSVEHHDGSIISWHRSPDHNHAVDGHPRSLHLWGLAIDADFNFETDARDFIAKMEECGFSCVYKPAGHTVHCQRWKHGQGPRP